MEKAIELWSLYVLQNNQNVLVRKGRESIDLSKTFITIGQGGNFVKFSAVV